MGSVGIRKGLGMSKKENLDSDEDVCNCCGLPPGECMRLELKECKKPQNLFKGLKLSDLCKRCNYPSDCHELGADVVYNE